MDRWKSAAVLEPWAGLGYNAMQGHLTFHLWNEGNTYDPLSQGPWPLSDFSRERARERIWVAYCVTRRRKVTHDEWTSFLLDGKIISKILPKFVVHGLWKIIRSATSWWRGRLHRWTTLVSDVASWGAILKVPCSSGSVERGYKRQKGRPKVPKEKERKRNTVNTRFVVRKLEGQSAVFMTLPGIQQWG